MPNIKKKLKNIRPEIWLIFILAFALFLRLHFFMGLGWEDDTHYAGVANEILKGRYYPSHVNEQRPLIIYPIAFFFKIFGINEFSGAMFSLICSLLSIILIYYFGKKFFSIETGLLAAFILSFFPLDVEYSTRIMGDVQVGFFTALSVFMFFLAESSKKKLFYFLAGTFTGLAYLVKLYGLLPLIFFFACFIYKIMKNKRIDFNFVYIIFGLFVILVIEGLFYYSKTKDFFFRFHKEFYFYTKKELLPYEFNINLEYYPSIMLSPNNRYFGLFYLFMVFGMMVLMFKRSENTFLLILWWLSFFLYMQYGTMSYKEYIPINRWDRYLTVLSIPSILILSVFLSELMKRSIDKKIFSLIMLVLIFIPSLFLIEKNYRSHEASATVVKLIYEFLKEEGLKKVYSDDLMIGHLRLYFNFQRDEYLRRIDWIKDCDELKDSFVIINASRRWIEYKPFISSLYDCVIHPPPNWQLVKVIHYKTDFYPYKYLHPVIYYVPK